MTGSYFWLYYRTADEETARAAFVLRFGREPKFCERDDNEMCWWMGPVSEAELKRWKRRRKARQLELAL